MGSIVLCYIIVGVLEYFRVAKDYLKHLQEDFPLHPIPLLEFCIFSVCLICGPTLLLMKLLNNIKNYIKNKWRRLLFPIRLKKFSKELDKISKEEDSKKSVELLFKAMKEVLK
tara:strand:+ start:202 stop:540 length:339 start_codon:yes stop_codon:yes gene_type:complete